MKVKALRRGFYDGTVREPGEVFDLTDEKHISEVRTLKTVDGETRRFGWMEPVEEAEMAPHELAATVDSPRGGGLSQVPVHPFPGKKEAGMDAANRLADAKEVKRMEELAKVAPKSTRKPTEPGEAEAAVTEGGSTVTLDEDHGPPAGSTVVAGRQVIPGPKAGEPGAPPSRRGPQPAAETAPTRKGRGTAPPAPELAEESEEEQT